MEQQQKQVSREAVADVGMESGQQHHQQEHHQQHQHHHQQQQSEWDSFGPDSCGSATLLGPFGAMAETLNAGTAEADKAGLDAVAKPRTTESPPASAAAAAAAATGYMEMGQMSDFEILAHEKGDESDVSPAGVRVELEMPKNWTSDFEAQKEVFYQDPSPSIFQDLSTGHGERFATAGLSEVDLNKAAGSPHSDEGQQIESCDSSPADDIVTVFPKPSALFTESSVASFQGRGSPEAVGSLSGKTSPSEDKTPKKATSPDKPMEKLIYLAQEKYLDTTVPQKRESDGEVLTKNPRKDERAEALKPRDAHVGEKQPVVYHPGYSEAETISISQESSPLEEISPISEEFTDKLIVASDEVQMRQPSTEMEYSISLSQESSPGEDSSPVTGNLGHVFPKPSAAATTVQQQQQQQLAGIDSSEEKQVPIAKKDNSLTSSYVSSSTEESSPGEEGVRVVGGGSKSGEKEDFVEEVAPLSHEEERSPRKTESRAGVDGKEPGFAVESLGASWGSEDDWPASEGVRAAEPAASSKGDLGGRVAGGNVAEEPHLGGKSPGVPPTRGAAAGGGHAEGPREEQTAADAHAANDFMDFEVGSAKQQPQQQPQQQPRQQEPAVAVSVAKFDTPPSAVRVIDSEEEEDDDDDEYENEFYSEETVASAAAPWVQKSLITVEEEELSKPGKVTVIPEPLGGAAGPPPQAAAAAEPKGPVAAPAAATAGPAPAGDEEEPKGFRPAQPPPTWPGFGPPTVIIEEAAEEGGEEREEPAPEVRPRGKPSEAAATAAAAAAEEEKQPEVEKKLPAKAEDGKSRQSLLEKIHLPAVSELVYWRDPRWSGGVLGVLLLLLLSIAHLSVFTIVGYLGLLMLTCTITWRVCRGVLCAVQKREDGHPFRTYLAEDVDVTRERMSRQVEAARVWTTGAATELRRLLLVQDLVDSLKFAGVLWLMTYVGSVFNGLSLLILGVVLLFSVPIAYEKKKTEVDHYLVLVQAKVDDATARVKSMIPAALRPNEANSSAK